MARGVFLPFSWNSFARVYVRRRLVADLAGRLELAVGDEAARVHDALRDPLAVEVADLLEEVVVLERRRAAAADGPLRLVVGHRVALTCRQGLVGLLVFLRHGACSNR